MQTQQIMFSLIKMAIVDHCLITIAQGELEFAIKIKTIELTIIMNL